MKTSRCVLAVVLFGLSFLCLALSACGGGATQPGETTPDSPSVTEADTSATTTPDTDPVVPDSETQSETPTESETDADTETTPVPERETEDPALNVFPTDGKYIDIGAFFEPDAAHTTEEHYDWLKAAYITYIDSVNWDTAITEAINIKQAELCAERGIRVSFYPSRFGVNVGTLTAEQVTDYCKEIMGKHPNFTDLHIVDEPADPWNYAQVIRATMQAGMYPRINFLPYWAPIFTTQNYQGHIEDTIIAVGREYYPTVYFDHYPYLRQSASAPDMFYNMELVRTIGLKYDLPTGLYLQAFGDTTCRRPTADEIRYQASAALAYGYKSLTYFTWWTTNPPENTDSYAIIAPDGSKTDLYDEVVKINGQITKTGALLAHLDALEIYHTAGKETGIVLATEAELPLFPQDGKRFGFVVSLMEDPDTGRDYIMLVNKNYKQEVTTPITVTDKISFLYNCTNGVYEEIDISTGTIELTFAPGGYVLLALGQKDNVVERKVDMGDNLAEGKPVAVDKVNPGNHFYAYGLTDGFRSNESADVLGYRSPTNAGVITIDLGRVTMLNRVDLYPVGVSINMGEAFPRAFSIEVSVDGTEWKTLVEKNDYDANGGVPVFTFDTVKAQYVRLTVTEGSAKGYFEIAEIEIYNDKGNIPLPDNQAPDVPEYNNSGNLATTDGVVVICSSAYEEGTFWRIDGINDGRIMDVTEADGLYCGWSSNVFVNTEQEGATEWIGFDFGKAVEVKALIAHPAQNSQTTPQGFPLSWCVEVSDDGITWRTLYEIEDDPTAGEFVTHIAEFDPVSTRFIRMRGTKLTTVGADGIFGYMMQMSEIEVIAAE